MNKKYVIGFLASISLLISYFIIKNSQSTVASSIKDISSQPTDSIQIINNTSEKFLHVFCQLNEIDSNQWQKLDGNGNIFPPVDWNTTIDGHKGGNSWDPLGAKLAAEVIIPQNGYIILQLPTTHPPAFVIMAIKMTQSDSDKPLTLDDGSPANRDGPTIRKVVNQSSILIEGGKDMVADASAVDGINFKIRYELTTPGGVKVTEIKENPCDGLDEKYQLPVGCHNPAKIDCPGSDTCLCCPDTQKCQFNTCSQKLFNVSTDSPWIDKYDYGNPLQCEESDKSHSYPLEPPVKGFINKSSNLKDNALKKFCNQMQSDSGDFTTYCYDYNDTSSSPQLSSPYKMRLTYSDLKNNIP